ncbi:MAG: sigma-70 family RNA polymerase sigma factor [Oscillospiraceae bacterium]|jgi:RNA polymerase sporulation-specific sigma factor|nr:sigma-70 family RNA polymerase sigma factor [Oscillospiraceae bacterium]
MPTLTEESVQEAVLTEQPLVTELSRDAFIEANMGLVYTCAKRLQGRGMEFDDLIQAGSLGLVKAADAFDKSRGLAFSTYAVPVILGEMKHLFRQGGPIKVGRTLKDKAVDLAKQRDALTEKLGREPSLKELAEETGMETTEAAMLLGATQPVLSLTIPEDSASDTTEWDVAVEGEQEKLTDRLALRQVMGKLDDYERKLVECRFFRNLTQSQTAKVLGTTQVQVSRHERKLLQKMRQLMDS